jgi:hypothetical protein
MHHAAYKLALIRRDQLLREAADHRLAAGSAAPVQRAASGNAGRFHWLARARRTPLRLTVRSRYR